MNFVYAVCVKYTCSPDSVILSYGRDRDTDGNRDQLTNDGNKVIRDP